MKIDTFRLHALMAALWGVAWLVMADLPAAAQQRAKVAHVGILSPEESDNTPAFIAFRKGLADLGYAEGKSVVLDFGQGSQRAPRQPRDGTCSNSC